MSAGPSMTAIESRKQQGRLPSPSEIEDAVMEILSGPPPSPAMHAGLFLRVWALEAENYGLRADQKVEAMMQRLREEAE